MKAIKTSVQSTIIRAKPPFLKQIAGDKDRSDTVIQVYRLFGLANRETLLRRDCLVNKGGDDTIPPFSLDPTDSLT